MGTAINEPIKVGAIFDRGVVKPAWFIWHGRRYGVQEITMRWQTKEGSAAILRVSVTDGASLFELAFNQQTLTWWLTATESDGCE